MTKIENLKVNTKSRPLADVVIANCGQLIKKRSAKDIEIEEELGERYQIEDGISSNFVFLVPKKGTRRRKSDQKRKTLMTKRRKTRNQH